MAKQLTFEENVRRTFAQRLKLARPSAGFGSAAHAAEALNVEAAAYRKWERGDAMPSLGMLERICPLLDVGANYLLPPPGRRKKWTTPKPP